MKHKVGDRVIIKEFSQAEAEVVFVKPNGVFEYLVVLKIGSSYKSDWYSKDELETK